MAHIWCVSLAARTTQLGPVRVCLKKGPGWEKRVLLPDLREGMSETGRVGGGKALFFVETGKATVLTALVRVGVGSYLFILLSSFLCSDQEFCLNST